jgi:aminoglycoside phosphotransferase (APT) family kinase protein
MTAPPDPHAGHPPAEIEIDEALVRALLGQQHPDLAGETITPAAFGWDNAMVRIGETLCARLPRRAVANPLALNEQKWLPVLAPHLPLPVPAPLRLGAPSALFPWAWAIVPWLEGQPASHAQPRADQAPILARFLRALHVTAPEEAPKNPVRGVPLQHRFAAIEERIAHLASVGEPLPSPARAAWEVGLAAPYDHPPVWLHGDMHARNILTHNGALSAIIDWGDITRGDPATDLASIWMLFEAPAAREKALAEYGCAESTYRRARGWAAAFAVVCRDAGLINNPPLAHLGAITLARFADGP